MRDRALAATPITVSESSPILNSCPSGSPSGHIFRTSDSLTTTDSSSPSMRFRPRTTGTFIVAIAYESLRGLEGILNEANIMSEPVVGLTEIVLALAMIAVLALRPGGLFPTHEIGALPRRRNPEQEA